MESFRPILTLSGKVAASDCRDRKFKLPDVLQISTLCSVPCCQMENFLGDHVRWHGSRMVVYVVACLCVTQQVPGDGVWEKLEAVTMVKTHCQVLEKTLPHLEEEVAQ